MAYPLWYMKPVHYMNRLIGVKEMAFGASGIDGKEALQKILTGLRQGYSTFLTPDGPKGPPKVMKNGVLLMSSKTGVPVIPISFYVEKSKRTNSWDKKRFPVFFSKITVVYGKPVVVSENNFEEFRQIISSAMDDPSTEINGSLKAPLH